MTVAVAVAVAVAVVLAAAVAYLAVRSTLRNEVDRALEDQLAERLEPRGRGGAALRPAARAARRPDARTSRSSTPAGTCCACSAPNRRSCRSTERARDAAAGVGTRYFADAEVDGTHVRVLTVPATGGLAVQFGRSLETADAVLANLRLILALVCVLGVALAVALGRLVSRNVVAPIVHVTEAARHIAATEDLGRRIEVETQDEVGELAAHFNAMLDTLERSVAAQRQLVADASHELRTPITSLRTNIEVLAESEALPADERARLLADVEEQITELGMLVADLIELARGDEPRREREDVRLDHLVVRGRRPRAAARARACGSRPSLEPAVVDGTRERLARAVNNLLDNAARHSPPGGVVEVRADVARRARARPRRRASPTEDLPHLFDRFYRGASARGRAGLRARAGDRAPGRRAARRQRARGQRGGRRRRVRAGAARGLNYARGRRICRELAPRRGRTGAYAACMSQAASAGIEVEGLVREFKNGPRAVDGIDLEVAPGEIYGFLGPNGAGKSTTVLMLTTLLPPTAGTARVAGHDILQGRAGRAVGDRRRAAGGRAGPAAHRPRPHAAGDHAAGRAEGAAARARRRADRARRADRSGRPQGRRLLGRHEAPPRPRAGARAQPARAVPRRADDRPRSLEPRRPVGRGRAPGARGRRDRLPHDAVPRGGRRAGRPGRDHRPRQDRRRGHAGGPEGGDRAPVGRGHADRPRRIATRSPRC